MSEVTLLTGIAGVGLLGPGLPDWSSGRAALRDPGLWISAPTVVAPPTRLPATERRRAGLGVKAAIAVADQACTMAGIDAALPATVFTSATGEPAICHALLETLATAERLVSPTRFTNSVHNAAAGYWHIAVRSMRPSTSLAAYDASAAAGLLEAVAMCVTSCAPVLLVAYDLPHPEPLHALRPLPDIFAFALLLLPAAQPAAWRLRLTPTHDVPDTHCRTPALDALRAAIPAARALPLLEAMARESPAAVVLDAEHGFALSLELERSA